MVAPWSPRPPSTAGTAAAGPLGETGRAQGQHALEGSALGAMAKEAVRKLPESSTG